MKRDSRILKPPPAGLHPLPGPSGWVVRAGHRRASESRLAPALAPLFLPPPALSSPQLKEGDGEGAGRGRGNAVSLSPPGICALERESPAVSLSPPGICGFEIERENVDYQ